MRRALTLLELIVVVCILAVVTGLLLPAIQKIRTSAMGIQSKNQLKQMSIANTGYVTDHDGHLPWMVVYVRPEKKLFFTTFQLLLPYLEQSDLYFSDLNQESNLLGKSVKNPAYVSPFDVPRVGMFQYLDRLTSYSGNAMVFFHPDLNSRFSDLFADGSSSTIIFTETRANCNGKIRYFDFLFPTSRFDGVQCPTFADHNFYTTGLRCEDYYPITIGSPPVSRAADGVTFQVVPTEDECDPRQPNALSRLGLHCAFADGSVRIFRKGVDPTVFWGAVTPAGGEVISFD